jgi:two-component system, OmpR family, sensor histidine kinase CiaH
MFRRIRFRLVAWTVLVLVLILVVLGATVYLAAERTLLQQVDRNLASRGDQAGPLFEGPARGGPPPPEREGYRGGVFYLAMNADGDVLVNPQRVDVSDIQVPNPTTFPGAYATVEVNGESARIFVRPLGPRAPPGTLLVVGQSLAPEESALASLLLVLLAGGAVGLLLSLAGAWFLAGRSLVPIEQAFRRQQEFVADASHELRTPLTVLRSATDLLNQHREQPLAANGELFDDIRLEIGRLERLAGDLLTLARSDQGELELAVAPVDLAVLTADVVRRTAPLAHQNDLLLSCRADGAELVAEVDPDRIQQVILILLDNAIKHTPAGGRIEVQVHQQGADGLIEVADSGLGIAAEHLPRIFDRFYRADLARSRAQGGSGLGLAIAKMLTEAHGGELSLSSTVGVGTRVTVRLRLASAAARGGRLAELASRITHGASRTAE